MKNLFMGLCLLVCLGFACTAAAAVQTYGPDFSRFTVDVPQGWTASPNTGGCQISSPDGASSVSIQINRSGGKSALELAQLIAADMPGEKNIEEEDGGVNIYATIDGVRVAVTVVADDDKFLVITVAGPDSATLDRIVNSLGDAE